MPPSPPPFALLNTPNRYSPAAPVVLVLYDPPGAAGRVPVPAENAARVVRRDGRHHAVELGDATSATLTILDNDEAGVRVLSPSGTATAIEGGADESFLVSLTSQPSDDVTITFDFAPSQTSRQLLIDQAYASSATSIGLRVSDSTIYSLLLPAGTYTFGTGIDMVTK